MYITREKFAEPSGLNLRLESYFIELESFVPLQFSCALLQDDGRAYFHTSYLYILKHFETFPHICVKKGALSGCPYFHIKYIKLERGSQNHPTTWEQCMALAEALAEALAVAFDHSAVKKPIKWLLTML
jgi:hypothetical protein